jgi:hypothetical protein
MRKTLIVTLVAGFSALALAKPALSLPSTPTIEHGQTTTGVIDVRYRDRYWRGRGYAYGYGYRPYYRPYGYYRPYAYGGYPYYRGYYGRPGISLGLSF